MKKRNIAGILLPAFMLAYGHTNAQTEDLDPVTITASVSPEKASRTGRNIVVIRGERFQQLPVHSLDELLRYLPGLEVQARGPMGSQSDIILRGGTFQQVLVLIDGVRVNDANTGHFSGYIPIAPREIERIEILKGASSAIYGSEAVGGVIHIITKTFASNNHHIKDQLQASVAAGGYGLVTGGAGGYKKEKRTAIGGGIISNNASGQQQRGTKGWFNNHTGSVSFSHQFSQQIQLSFRTAIDYRDFSAQNFYTSFISDTAQERVKTLWNQLQFSFRNNSHHIRLSAGFKDLDDRYAFNKVAAPNQNRSRLLQALLSDEISISKSGMITGGVQYIKKTIRSNDRGDHDLSQAGLFALLHQQLGSQVVVSPGVRLEWNQRSGYELIPQVNASWKISSIILRASAGKTTRDADFTERFNNYNKTIVNSGRIGNPDLSAERSFSYEAGLDFLASGNFKISAGVFRREHTRLIDYVITPYSQMPRQENLNPNGSFALAKNIASVNTTGAETDIHFQSVIGKGNLWATAGLVWLWSRSSDSLPSFYLASHARFLGNFNIRYAQGIFAVSFNGLYKNRNAQEASSAALAKISSSYFLLNGMVEAMAVKNKLSIYLQADNIFDRQYADILGAQMPGRWLSGGIKLNLSKN